MGCQALSDDASSRHVPRVSTDTNMPRAGLRSDVKHPHVECGGAPTYPGLGSPCGSLVPRIAGEGEACLLSPPCQPLSALSCEGMGTQCIISNDVSGGSPADPAPGFPCGRLVLDSSSDRDASRRDHRSQSPGRLHYNHEILSFECYNTSQTTQRFPDGSNERYSRTHHGR